MRNISYVVLIAALAGCGNETEVTEPSEALALGGSSSRYEVDRFSSSLGGTVSVGTSINNRGWVAGFSNLSGNDSTHAALWRHGSILDLGTLGGPNSDVQWPGLNDRGVIVGIAETAEVDSLDEDWSCSAFFPTATDKVCRGFVWEDHKMRALPTLGGTHGFATSVNNWGQVVGWAETPVHDPTCSAPQVLQFRAVVWETRWGRIRTKQLRPLHGDSTSAATAINDRGQVVGISGECDDAVGDRSATHAVLWEKGRVTEIDDLGGEFWHTPMDINDRGDVVGFGNPSGVVGGALRPHAFLWTKRGGIEDLGTLPGDSTSQAFAINSRGQVVGRSCAGVLARCRGVIWQHGVLTNLNDVAGPEFPDVYLITAARDINDAGKITGNLVEQSSRTIFAYVATRTWGKP
ncbi:MAG: hypothetical protein ACREMX_05385 [Gemmatimonadales bacterium]